MNTLRIFNHHVHLKFLILGIVHFVALVACVFAAVEVRYAVRADAIAQDYPNLLLRACVFSAMIIVCLSAMGIYRPQRQNRHVPLLVRVAAAMALGTVGAVLAFYALPWLYLGRGILSFALLFSLFAISAIQLVFYVALDQRSAPWRVLFYGAGSTAVTTLSYMRRRSDHSLFYLVGCVPASGEETQIEESLICRIAAGQSLEQFARENKINEIVVMMDDRRHEFPADDLIDCRVAGITVSDTLSFYERMTGKVKTELLQPSWIIFSDGFRRGFFDEMFKRLMDFALTLVVFIPAFPLMLLTAAAIKWEEGLGAPVFFSQLRVGLNGRDYHIYKFRSMRIDAEALSGPQWASENDPRVTRVGYYIRKFRLDELPQLWNVLRGNMSLVGPRPERPEFVRQLVKSLPYYRVRECVKPGITGWAQLGYPYGASEEDANGKLQLDLYYVKNRSLFLDLLILMNTIEVVVFRKGGR